MKINPFTDTEIRYNGLHLYLACLMGVIGGLIAGLLVAYFTD